MGKLFKTILVFVSLCLLSDKIDAQFTTIGDNCLPNITDKIKCTLPFSSVVDPENCNQYVTCLPERDCENRPTYIGIRYTSCPLAMFFDQTEGKCVDTMYCPSDPTKVKPCVHFLEGKRFALKGSCSKYKECVYEDGKGDWVTKTCEAHEYFDKVYGECVEGNCPGCYEPAPWYAKCETDNIEKKFGHLYDCTKYFVCKKNLDDCERPGWGRDEGQCPEGQFFDVSIKECSPGTECPQICLPKAEDNERCTRDEQIIGDCREGGICSTVETCPGKCYRNYMGLARFSCTGEDEYFDTRRYKCVKQFKCPKEDGERKCPVYWDLMAEKGFNGELVEDESWCRVFVGGQKEYEYGLFNAKDRKCIIESKEQPRYEVLSIENTHLIANQTSDKDRNSLEVASYGLVGASYLFTVCDQKISYRDARHKSEPYFIDTNTKCTEESWFEFICKPTGY